MHAFPLRNKEASKAPDIHPRPPSTASYVKAYDRGQIRRQADEYTPVGAGTEVVRVRADHQLTQGVSSLRKAIEDTFSYRTV